MKKNSNSWYTIHIFYQKQLKFLHSFSSDWTQRFASVQRVGAALYQYNHSLQLSPAYQSLQLMTSQCKTSSDPHYASFPAPDIRWRARMRHLCTFWLADWKSSSYAFPQAPVMKAIRTYLAKMIRKRVTTPVNCVNFYPRSKDSLILCLPISWVCTYRSSHKEVLTLTSR